MNNKRPAYTGPSNIITFMYTSIDDFMLEAGEYVYKPTLRIFGVDENGSSIGGIITDFYPFFYVKPVENVSIDEVRNKILNVLEKKNVIVSCDEIYDKKTMYEYTESNELMYKFCVTNPSYLGRITKLFDEGRFYGYFTELYETKIDYVTKFTSIVGLSGFQWLRVKNPSNLDKNILEFNTNIQFSANWKDIEPIPLTEKSTIAPIRILSFDIECKTAKYGAFPNPNIEGDNIIEIASSVYQYGEKPAFIESRVHNYNPDGQQLDNPEFVSFSTEHEMLSNWSKFVREVDPDIITVIC